MQTRKYRDASAVEQWRHCSTTWTSSFSAVWNVASSSYKMMTYNLVEPDGVTSLLKVNGSVKMKKTAYSDGYKCKHRL